MSRYALSPLFVARAARDAESAAVEADVRGAMRGLRAARAQLALARVERERRDSVAAARLAARVAAATGH